MAADKNKKLKKDIRKYISKYKVAHSANNSKMMRVHLTNIESLLIDNKVNMIKVRCEYKNYLLLIIKKKLKIYHYEPIQE